CGTIHGDITVGRKAAGDNGQGAIADHRGAGVVIRAAQGENAAAGLVQAAHTGEFARDGHVERRVVDVSRLERDIAVDVGEVHRNAARGRPVRRGGNGRAGNI